MTDMFTADVSATDVIAMLDRLAHSADFVVREVGHGTAQRIVAEAQRRIARATGATASEIHFELTRDGKGYIVLAYQVGVGDYPVDQYLERGTEYMRERPFFFRSAELEESGHRMRLIDRITEWLEAVGR
jgi:hypothetical protein